MSDPFLMFILGVMVGLAVALVILWIENVTDKNPGGLK